ncbi:hypothetical protein [Aurantiacibacter odishensis]|uniref:hypothetical protein n=1 Tax=Aurantiacibacter odishensis TaxID=1155476 RepID=UPI000E71689F|nr:hypothetical protein [Aurantiacibacter odishensis]
MATPIPAPAQDSSPRVFEASGPWTADFGEDYCRLVLSLRSDADETTLAFERIQPGPAMRVLIIGDSIRSFRGADTIGYHFASSRDQRPTEKSSDFSSSRTPDDRRLTIVSFISIEPAPEITQVFQRRTNAGDEPTFALGSPAGEAGQSPGYDPEVERERAAAIDHLVFDRGLQRAV